MIALPTVRHLIKDSPGVICLHCVMDLHTHGQKQLQEHTASPNDSAEEIKACMYVALCRGIY